VGKTTQQVPYEALVVVSPALLLGEEKNQDRARWCGPRLVGAVADGTTTSPHAAEGAGVAVNLSPVLFTAGVQERLDTLCDLLQALRAEALDAGIMPTSGVNPALQKMLRDVVRQKTQTSYQTTLIAVHLRTESHCVIVHSIGCGDSAFFAFSPEGDLLASSLTHAGRRLDEGSRRSLSGDAIAFTEFGPGDELLARVICDASEERDLAEATGIRQGSAGKWLVCQPLDRSAENGPKQASRPPAARSLHLQPDDLLLVPRYLVTFPDDPHQRRYCRFPFSRHIRKASGGLPSITHCRLDEKGTMTAVLPDSFLAGHWYETEERFEPDSEFVLASDGFYSAFADTAELWAWLTANQTELASEPVRQSLLEALHAQLHAKSGDDDMSFIWIRPRNETLAEIRNAELPNKESGNAR
jgi:serine/threonine protein phosphatase PrpC